MGLEQKTETEKHSDVSNLHTINLMCIKMTEIIIILRFCVETKGHKVINNPGFYGISHLSIRLHSMMGCRFDIGPNEIKIINSLRIAIFKFFRKLLLGNKMHFFMKKISIYFLIVF